MATDKERDRQRRMREAVDKQRAKNNTPEAKAKRAAKAAWWDRQKNGG